MMTRLTVWMSGEWEVKSTHRCSGGKRYVILLEPCLHTLKSADHADMIRCGVCNHGGDKQGWVALALLNFVKLGDVDLRRMSGYVTAKAKRMCRMMHTVPIRMEAGRGVFSIMSCMQHKLLESCSKNARWTKTE